MSAQRPIRRGTRVRITRADVFGLYHRVNRTGRVVRVDGGYIYVRPMWWPRNRPPLELYDGEVEVLP